MPTTPHTGPQTTWYLFRSCWAGGNNTIDNPLHRTPYGQLMERRMSCEHLQLVNRRWGRHEDITIPRSIMTQRHKYPFGKYSEARRPRYPVTQAPESQHHYVEGAFESGRMTMGPKGQSVTHAHYQ